MIAGVTCAHCQNREWCIEDSERGMICRSFCEDWEAIEADPSTRKQGRAEKKRRRKAIRKEIEDLNDSCKNEGRPGEAPETATAANSAT